MNVNIENPQNYSVALYLRLSKEDDKREGGRYIEDDSESIKNQRVLLEDFAREQKLAIYDVYIDDGYSGTSFKRPSFERMIKDIEAKKVNMVITKDMSRLGRDYIDTGHYMERYFPSHEVRYIALIDNVDTGAKNYTGDITPFKALINDMYAKDTSIKITSIKRSKQEKGLFVGGKAPYGYKKSETNKNVFVVDEPAAKVVKYIFALALEGKSCRQIAMILNEEKIPTPAQYSNLTLPEHKGPYSGKWSAERVTWTLKNEVYIGSMVQGRLQKVSYKVKKCRHMPREEWKVVENTHPPIVDKEIFQKANMLIESRSCTRYRTYDYLLKGIIVCHECQYPLAIINRPTAKGEDSLFFVCRTYQRFTKYDRCTCHNIKVETVTNAVVEQVRNICKQYLDYLDYNELANEAQKVYLAEMRRQEKDVAILKEKLETITVKIDKTYDDKLSGLIDEETFTRIYQKLKEEQLNLKQKISHLKEFDKEKKEFDSHAIRELVERFLNAKQFSRELIVSLIDKVELTDDKEVIIFFKFKELDFLNNIQ